MLDKWLEKYYPNVKFVRYADDVIVHCKTHTTLQNLANQLNAQSRGIIRYFGVHSRWRLKGLFRHLDYRLAKWVKGKYKTIKSYKQAFDWLRKIQKNYPNLFYHWSIVGLG